MEPQMIEIPEQSTAKHGAQHALSARSKVTSHQVAASVQRAHHGDIEIRAPDGALTMLDPRPKTRMKTYRWRMIARGHSTASFVLLRTTQAAMHPN